MGLMYWQINDIWQAPTWATIEYGLKWKLSHYYVRHMYAPVYPAATLTPYLANVTDETAQISFYLVNDLFSGTQGQLFCSLYSLDTFLVRLTVVYDVFMDSPGVQRVANLPYALIMKRAACNSSSSCLVHCSYNTNSNLPVGQTLFLARPKDYQLYQPNIQVQSIVQKSDHDFDITLTASGPALFVWLDVPKNTIGYFSRNGFHMFEPSMTVSFTSWTPLTDFHASNLNVTVTSLYDVTML